MFGFLLFPRDGLLGLEMAIRTIGITGISHLRDWRVFAVTAWLCALVSAFGFFLNYSFQAGPKGSPPSHWPSEIRFHKNSGCRLLMFAHPRCSCTMASLRELGSVMTRAPQLKPVCVFFYQPSNASEDWNDTAVVRKARKMNGVEIAWDRDGFLAHQFGAKTSGHVLLYDARDRLQFSGGITGLRSHEGWNPGSATLLALIQGNTAQFTETRVFGCPIFNSSDECTDGKCETRP